MRLWRGDPRQPCRDNSVNSVSPTPLVFSFTWSRSSGRLGRVRHPARLHVTGAICGMRAEAVSLASASCKFETVIANPQTTRSCTRCDYEPRRVDASRGSEWVPGLSLEYTLFSMQTADRQLFLWSSAQRAHQDAPALSQVLLLGLNGVCRADGAPLPARAQQRACSWCFTLLVPGFSCKIKQQRHPRRPAQRRHSLCVSCFSCGRTTKFPMVTPQSSRAGIANQSAPQALPTPVPANTGKKAKRQAPPTQPASKRTRTVPATQPPKPAANTDTSSGGFFGFDFVPL